MEKVWLGLGSNLGDSQQILQRAWKELGKKLAVTTLSLSSPYASDPVDMKSEHRFLNAVGILETDLDPHVLLALLQELEKGFGRNKKTGAEGYQDRLLDLDILYFGDRVSVNGDLLLPHPHISGRLFVLAPLVEIDPARYDSRIEKNAEEMYNVLLLNMKNGVVDVQGIQQELWVPEK